VLPVIFLKKTKAAAVDQKPKGFIFAATGRLSAPNHPSFDIQCQ
jgi:hypothetical protein